MGDGWTQYSNKTVPTEIISTQQTTSLKSLEMRPELFDKQNIFLVVKNVPNGFMEIWVTVKRRWKS